MVLRPMVQAAQRVMVQAAQRVMVRGLVIRRVLVAPVAMARAGPVTM